MWAKALGAHISPVRATTVTRLFIAGCLAAYAVTPLSTLGAADAFGLFLNRVVKLALIDAVKVSKACNGDRLCAARLIVETLGPPAQLEAVTHPDTDSIRRVTSQSSISDFRAIGPSTYIMNLDRFGRKLTEEIQAHFKSTSGITHLILDLRKNQGGDFDRMRRAAALLTGPVERAIELNGNPVDIPPPTRQLAIPRLTVLIGPRTASSAEILTVLLRKYADAGIFGTRSVGKDYLYRMVPVTQDWRLLLPAEQIVVPGETLTGGVRPDGPTPKTLARQLN